MKVQVDCLDQWLLICWIGFNELHRIYLPLGLCGPLNIEQYTWLKKESGRRVGGETRWSFCGFLLSAHAMCWLYFDLSHFRLNLLRGALVCPSRATHRGGALMHRKWSLTARHQGERPHHHWTSLRRCRNRVFQHFIHLRVAAFHKKEQRGREMVRKSVWVYLLSSRWCKLAADTIFEHRDDDRLHQHQKEWLFFPHTLNLSFSVFIPLFFS